MWRMFNVIVLLIDKSFSELSETPLALSRIKFYCYSFRENFSPFWILAFLRRGFLHATSPFISKLCSDRRTVDKETAAPTVVLTSWVRRGNVFLRSLLDNKCKYLADRLEILRLQEVFLSLFPMHSVSLNLSMACFTALTLRPRTREILSNEAPSCLCVTILVFHQWKKLKLLWSQSNH